jgi:hypothetical protein
MGCGRTHGVKMKNSYKVVYNNQVVGTRKSERVYTHAVVALYNQGANPKTVSFASSKDKAQKVANSYNSDSLKHSISPTNHIVVEVQTA